MEEPTTVQAETSLEDENLFDGYEEETAEDTPVETVTEEPKTEPEAPFLEIKYNSETRGLTQEEARTLAQKGMNYDKVYNNHSQLMNTLNDFARRAGVNSVDELLNQLDGTLTQYSLNQEMESLRKQYPDADDDVLKAFANEKLGAKKDRAFRENTVNQQSKADAQQNEIRRQLDAFNKHYPNVDASKLDNEVYDLMKQNYTLLEAYGIVEGKKATQLREKNESKKKADEFNEGNRKRSLGNTNSVSAVEADDFMSGFLNG